jgi:hypothetical protein
MKGNKMIKKNKTTTPRQKRELDPEEKRLKDQHKAELAGYRKARSERNRRERKYGKIVAGWAGMTRDEIAAEQETLFAVVNRETQKLNPQPEQEAA